MAFVRSLWVLVVTHFELHFGAGDKWWPMVFWAGIAVVACILLGMEEVQRQIDVMIAAFCYFCAIMFCIFLRRWRGTPTARPLQVWTGLLEKSEG